MTVIEITDDTYADTINNNPAVLVDFWAAWCGPCRMIGPMLDELSEKYNGKVLFCKVNVDENQKVAMDNGIMAIPTLKLYKNGEVFDTIVGVVPRDSLAAVIDKLIAQE
ncbi:MAG: thioredoxin [Candidatus Syntrophoarchaeum caldarius]|uniref:Thioredoxin n=1 Tax=Candidatus Syntropharchaeum caldarium TaxID=1838285 RepID=A0A1F2PD30_9EURY|nr:MAG: thioredoxin [Candidatus Syntrophoarchaeum caldarius]